MADEDRVEERCRNQSLDVRVSLASNGYDRKIINLAPAKVQAPNGSCLHRGYPRRVEGTGVNEFLVVRAGTQGLPKEGEIVYAGVKEQGDRVVSKFVDMAGEDETSEGGFPLQRAVELNGRMFAGECFGQRGETGFELNDLMAKVLT
jgi:hypothetical protein